ncbi:sigma-70 family RNA polymerase sigma factor [Methylosinus sporium]|uniref:Sigma-70 family RNA polymerase sigma factor n=1 Tax=Methylosinus sporium TaxID=428 RepID=A0A549SDU8_METSR|nr:MULTISPECIES: sigma-70 family RNA polymerase sigma factor [Methylosinus]MBU3890425.1 sigma-70 family RNA polymerase sigma factor [Methylosinus sp. KRF6]TRL26656.1 sigma-70 family RNA polymerase sigma factor [Methylosinus sporium]
MSKSKSRLIGELFERNKRDLLGCLTRRVGHEDAFDLLQETFVRLLRRRESGPIVDEDAYLRTTAINLARDFSRQSKSMAKHVTPGDIPTEIAEAGLDPSQIFEAKESVRLFYASLKSLPPKCREVFILRRFHDLSPDEIAHRLGISRNMVLKHLRLALERCHAGLD